MLWTLPVIFQSLPAHIVLMKIYIYIDFFTLTTDFLTLSVASWTRIKGFYANDVTRDGQ